MNKIQPRKCLDPSYVNLIMNIKLIGHSRGEAELRTLVSKLTIHFLSVFCFFFLIIIIILNLGMSVLPKYRYRWQKHLLDRYLRFIALHRKLFTECRN